MWYWLELDLGPPEEHSVLSTTNPFLQSLLFNLFNNTQDFNITVASSLKYFTPFT